MISKWRNFENRETKFTVTLILGIYMILYQGCDTPFGHHSWTTIEWNAVQIQHDSKGTMLGHWFWLRVSCDLDVIFERGLQPLMTTFVHHSVRKGGGGGCNPKNGKKMTFFGKIFRPKGGASPATLPLDPPMLCEVLSRSNMEVGSYGMGMDFDYTCMCTVTGMSTLTVIKLTLEIWHLVGPWHSWVNDNNEIAQT